MEVFGGLRRVVTNELVTLKPGTKWYISGVTLVLITCSKVVRTYVGQYVLCLEYNEHICLYDRYPSLAQTKITWVNLQN